jgi:hypothetical protein
MKKPLLAVRLGGLAGIVALVALVAALAPAAASARATTCANKQVKISPEAGHIYKIPVKAISTQGGVSCKAADKVITGFVTGKPPKGWKSKVAHFEAPEGLIPQLVTKGSKKIQYAVQGG